MTLGREFATCLTTSTCHKFLNRARPRRPIAFPPASFISLAVRIFNRPACRSTRAPERGVLSTIRVPGANTAAHARKYGLNSHASNSWKNLCGRFLPALVE